MAFLRSFSSILQFRTKSAHPENIKWISYHIPKTAGSSLRFMLYKQYGRTKIFDVYRPSDAKTFGLGNEIHIPNKTCVIHGHFKPHPQHKAFYVNSHSMVWVRDPIQRIWSLVGHLMDLQFKHPHYETIYDLYISKGIDNQADIVERIIKDKTIPYMVDAYTRFFSALDIQHISFVGSMHNFSGSIDRLNQEFDLTLQPMHRNSRTKSGIPNSLSRLSKHMEHEYSLVDSYL